MGDGTGWNREVCVASDGDYAYPVTVLDVYLMAAVAGILCPPPPYMGKLQNKEGGGDG